MLPHRALRGTVFRSFCACGVWFDPYSVPSSAPAAETLNIEWDFMTSDQPIALSQPQQQQGPKQQQEQPQQRSSFKNGSTTVGWQILWICFVLPALLTYSLRYIQKRESAMKQHSTQTIRRSRGRRFVMCTSNGYWSGCVVSTFRLYIVSYSLTTFILWLKQIRLYLMSQNLGLKLYNPSSYHPSKMYVSFWL